MFAYHKAYFHSPWNPQMSSIGSNRTGYLDGDDSIEEYDEKRSIWSNVRCAESKLKEAARKVSNPKLESRNRI